MKFLVATNALFLGTTLWVLVKYVVFKSRTQQYLLEEDGTRLASMLAEDMNKAFAEIDELRARLNIHEEKRNK